MAFVLLQCQQHGCLNWQRLVGMEGLRDFWRGFVNLHTPGSHQSSLNKRSNWLTYWQGKAMIGWVWWWLADHDHDHNKFIFLSVQKFIYTVHRYHFVNDPHDLWLSLQNILTLVSKIFLLIFYIDLPYWQYDLTSTLWQSWLATWSPFKYCVSLSPILNGSVHWGIVFTLSKGNEMNWMNVCVMCFSYIYISSTLQYRSWSMSLLH